MKHTFPVFWGQWLDINGMRDWRIQVYEQPDLETSCENPTWDDEAGEECIYLLSFGKTEKPSKGRI
jgi:hypothetical protein